MQVGARGTRREKGERERERERERENHKQALRSAQTLT